MKKRTLTVGILLGIALLFLLLKRHSAPSTTGKVFDLNQPNSSSQTEIIQTNSSKSVTSEIFPNPSVLLSNQLEQRKIAMEQSLDEWRTPIEFYGKVVDQTGSSVANARIDFSCNDLSPDGTSFYQTTSDTDGQFSINQIKGKLLTVKVAKDGYYASKRDNDSFYYAGQNENFKPDGANPVIFHLQKKGKAVPLIVTDYPGFAKIEQVKGDGTPVEIDLLKGAKVAIGKGHLKLEFWRDAPQRGVKKFNWKYRISVVGGGLVATDEEYNYIAVEDGYEPSVEIEMPLDKDKWQNEVRRNYYLRLPDGKYCRIEIYLLARNGVYSVRSFINASGSRNLEYDEAVQPKPTVHE